MGSQDTLPTSMKALVVRARGDAGIDTVPVPRPGPGSITIRVLHAFINKQANNFVTGNAAPGGLPLELPYPLIPGGHGIGRVAAAGPDTTVPGLLQPGQLVMFEPFVRARDDQEVAIMTGAFAGIDERTQKFTRDNWRNGAWAEYTRQPLENTYVLDEGRLIDQLGLGAEDLDVLGPLSVLYGGLRKIDVKAGETIVVTPATGFYSAGTIAIARAMGASVIAVSRDEKKLAEMETVYPGLKTVCVSKTQDVTAAIVAHGRIDAVVDVSPPEAVGSEHLGQAIQALPRYGRVCLMGGRQDTVLQIPYRAAVFKDLTIRGSWMYEREHVLGLVKMVESGALKLGKQGGYEVIGSYPLDQYKEAMVKAGECSATQTVVISPS